MTTLRKDAIIEIIPGKPGVEGTPGVPGRAGYYVTTTRYTAHTEAVPAVESIIMIGGSDPNTGGSVGSGEITLTEGQNIRAATPSEIGLYIPTLSPLLDLVQNAYDNNSDPSAAWAKYHTEETRILQAEMDSGVLGRPLAMLSGTYGPNAFMAAWDGGGITFYVFTGFLASDMPTQTYVGKG